LARRNGQRYVGAKCPERTGCRHQNTLARGAVSEQSLKRFMREIEVAATLKHKNVVSYIEHGTHNGIVYLVTEYVSGMDASRLAKVRGGKLNFQEVVKIIEQTLAASNSLTR
jgi:serine/threonine protein kinase